VSFEADSRSSPYSLAEALAAGVGQLRDRNLRFPVRHLQRGEVGLPEVPVILLGLLRAHGDGDAARLVPVARLLFDLAAAPEDVLLPGDLVRERLLCALVTGDVLHLGAVHVGEGVVADRPVGGDLALGDQGDVGVDAQAPVAGRVEDAEVLQHLFQLRQKARVSAGDRKSGSVTISIRGVPARL